MLKRLTIDKNKYPGFYYGFFVALIYNIIGYVMGIALRYDVFPKGLEDYGNAIIFLFVPVASQVADFTIEKSSDFVWLILSLLATFLIIWVIFSPLVTLFRGIIKAEK